MKYSSIPLAQTVVMHCKAKEIRDIVISPGSRNAPLTIGFTEDPYFNCFSIVDERSAAFFALGMAQQLKRPVAVLCTSGSALLNYYPAVAEAFYSTIPIVVLSADRPFYKIDVGDGQTIRQDHVFHRHIGYSAHLKQDVSHATGKVRKYAPHYIDKDVEGLQNEIQAFNDKELEKAIALAYGQRLPVHINVPMEEPLYDKVAHPFVHPPLSKKEESVATLDSLDGFLQQWNAAKRKMVLVGVNGPNSIEGDFLDGLGNDPSVIVLTETTSNLHHPRFFPSIDSIIAPIEKSGQREELFKALQPDILLTFGGLIVSKKIKAFLRKYKPGQHWHIDPLRANDTFFALNHHFKEPANDFLKRFLPKVNLVESGYFEFWNQKKSNYGFKRAEYLQSIPFSDFKAFKYIFDRIPDGVQLQMANSSTIRYAQLFDIKPTVEVFCNRGTSGIDGSVSTAVGAAMANGKPTVLITGDLSFFYDSNGLWNNYLRSDFRIILINNEGGGIFRILPGQEESETYATYFETAHHLNAEHLCKMYGLEYCAVDEENTLRNALDGFFENAVGPKLIEVKTPRLLNNKILLEYFDFIS
ncbi:2-succinyl-5-enolpyruvyl-6-hydroxy-3-cyclohexene-1-carboxylic-acid synthase [Maribacter polysaccharolyticus]|uniref:2-succinyl-5-enolpyruvyl-6-hydroxy-3- cyclohexene-1-carboxylic-acid synthase n=1 Tax=Maribacter polysaccharolyticus TaxID=3020831 RepID=UPI00237EFB04|nr:2-succinyl-5-enolpyruvyl-6-hydroxy-3-cyclohexene-1-carboxylic-acid synthase [Maribacter polysaccharolyticus]MDE3743397.1 2-succinyl-5-enolpyruvyl-6-hydroxy-3-cyclohexene-1-carboxylic-acid synthase [Maribacter polysaccharolyticus]